MIIKSFALTVLIFLIGLGQLTMAQNQTYSSDEIAKNKQFLNAFNPLLYGEDEKALADMESYAEKHSRDAVAQYQLGRLKMKMERDEEALEHIQKAIRLDRTNKWYLMTEADVLKKLKRFSEASEVYEKLHNKYPGEISYPMDQAYCLFRSGNIEQALEALNSLERDRGVREEISQKKILILETMRRDNDVISEYQKLIEIFPAEINYSIRLAQFYDSRGNFDKAREYYRKVLEYDPTNSTANYALINLQSSSETSIKKPTDQISLTIKDNQITEDEKLRALVPYLQDLKVTDTTDVKNLVTWSQQLVEEYPKSAKSNAFLGDVYYYSGQIPKAKHAYNKSLLHIKSVYSVWEKILECYFITADYESLYSKSKEALVYFPNRVQLYIQYAYAASHIDKGNQALPLLMNAEMMTGNNVLLKQDIQALKLLVNFNMKQYNDFMIRLGSSSYISPRSVLYLIEVAENNKIEITPIINAAEKKLKEFPDQEYAAYALALAEFKVGQFKKAEKYINSAQKYALGIKPHINFMQGQIMEELGKETNATEAFQLAEKQGYKVN